MSGMRRIERKQRESTRFLARGIDSGPGRWHHECPVSDQPDPTAAPVDPERRIAIKRAAQAGLVAWTVPAVVVLDSSAAWAQAGTPGPTPNPPGPNPPGPNPPGPNPPGPNPPGPNPPGPNPPGPNPPGPNPPPEVIPDVTPPRSFTPPPSVLPTADTRRPRTGLSALPKTGVEAKNIAALGAGALAAGAGAVAASEAMQHHKTREATTTGEPPPDVETESS